MLKKKFFVAVLAVVLMFTCFSYPPFDVNAEAVSQEPAQFVLPDIITEQEAQKGGYVSRVQSEEFGLNTFVFENEDGTHTLRFFDHPVKYIDDNGKEQDINLSLKKAADGSFVTAANDVVSTFPQNLYDGISLQYEDIKIGMVPETSSSLTASKASIGVLNDKTVSYPYGNKTSLDYSLTYTGFKEDIVVQEYTGQTEYNFLLFTNGLSLVNDNGTYLLVDSEKQVKATIGSIIIFTADEKNNTFGSMTYTEIKQGSIYALTIHVDADFLADEATQYPIRIDPTIEIVYNGNNGGAIDDVTINNSMVYSGYSGSLHVGRHDSGSISRALMKFHGLNFSNIISGEYIESAYVELRDVMCQSDQPLRIQCCNYNPLYPAWYENLDTTWNDVGGFDSEGELKSYFLEVSYNQGNAGAQRYSFNITQIAKEWARGGSLLPERGVVFKASDSFENQTGTGVQYYLKTFASFDRSEYRPSLTINYTAYNYDANVIPNGTYYIINKQSLKSLDVEGPSTASGANIQIWNVHNGDQGKWIINYNSTERAYTIKSKYSNLYMGVWMGVSVDGARIQQQTSISECNHWKIIPSQKNDDGDNGYILYANHMCNERAVLATDPTSQPGSDCYQYDYVADVSYYDEWYIIPVDNRLNVDVRIDQGMVDNCHGYNYALSFVNDSVRGATEWFLEEHNLLVSFDCIQGVALDIFTSQADRCPSDYDEECTCTSINDNNITDNDGDLICENNHKNIYQMCDMLFQHNINSTIAMLITGHDTCSSGDSEVIGLTDSNLGNIVIKKQGAYTETCGVIIHEINHLFGVDDHGNDKEIIYTCIHGTQAGGSPADPALLPIVCVDCRAVINANVGMYDH